MGVDDGYLSQAGTVDANFRYRAQAWGIPTTW